MSVGNEYPPSTKAQSTESGQWQLLAKPKSGESRAPSGRPPSDLVEKEAKRSGYVAVYVIGLTGVDGNPNEDIRIGTATIPEDIFKTAQQWQPRDVIVYAVCWTPSKLDADKLKRRMELELAAMNLRGSWYGLNPRMVCNTLFTCAVELGTDLFSDAERWHRLEARVQAQMEREQKRRPLLANAMLPAMHTPRPSGEIITFGRPKK